VVIDSLWVRPCYRHYYFGDYYGVTYREYGFESCAAYSRGHYDAIFVYERWEHRAEPSWFSLQIGVYNDRCAGRVPCPPRTLVQQNTIIQQNITNVTNVTNVKNVTNNVTNVTNNTTNINRTTVNKNTVLMPATQMAAAKNGAVRTVAVDNATRVQAKQQAQALQQVTAQRTQAETPTPGGRPAQARAVSLNVPQTKPVGPPSSTTPRAGSSTNAASNARAATPISKPVQPGTAATNPQGNPRQPA